MGEEEGGRRGDPETQAIGAVHQPAEHAVAGTRAQADNHVERTVLARHQVGQAPRGEHAERQEKPG